VRVTRRNWRGGPESQCGRSALHPDPGNAISNRHVGTLEPGADGAIEAESGIEFIFPSGRVCDLTRLKRISGPKVSGIVISSTGLSNPTFAFGTAFPPIVYFPIGSEPCKLPCRMGAQVNRDHSSAVEDAGRFKITQWSAVLILAWEQMTGLRTIFGCLRKFGWSPQAGFVGLRRCNAVQQIDMLGAIRIPPEGACAP
jgi:hypothetical protein